MFSCLINLFRKRKMKKKIKGKTNFLFRNSISMCNSWIWIFADAIFVIYGKLVAENCWMMTCSELGQLFKDFKGFFLDFLKIFLELLNLKTFLRFFLKFFEISWIFWGGWWVFLRFLESLLDPKWILQKLSHLSLDFLFWTTHFGLWHQRPHQKVKPKR